jgi:ADP-ribosylglycohydrolase
VTLACITGAIAEAYYGSIPQWIEEIAWNRIPTKFQDIILYLQKATDYRIRTQF